MDIESLAQAFMQESFFPLPPPRTPTPSGHECRAVSASLVYNINNPLLQWLQSPLPEIKIKHPDWQLNHHLHLNLALVIKKVVNFIPTYHFLELYNSKTFKDPDAVFN